MNTDTQGPATPGPETTLEYRGRQLQVERYPERDASGLRAWNAADEYLLHLLGEALPASEARILTVNDEFGALSLALSEGRIDHLGDSLLARKAAAHNAQINGVDAGAIRFLAATRTPAEFAADSYDIVLIRIPRSIAFLEYQLNQIKPALRADTLVYAAGMTRHLAPDLRAVFNRHLGPVKVLPTRKKAVVFRLEALEHSAVYPQALEAEAYRLEFTDFAIWSYPNVFAHGRLDKGTRLLLECIPAGLGEGASLADLGCGSGIAALQAALRNPGARLYCVDESDLALASARKTLAAAGIVNAEFIAGDGLQDFEPASIDLVVSNPPFHSNAGLSMQEAQRLFAPVYRALKPGGRFIVVAGRNYNYGPALSGLFEQVEVLAKNKGYIVTQCRKTVGA